MTTGGATPYLTGAAITAAVTITLWFANKVLERDAESKNRETARENFVRALFAEVDFNTRDMEEFISNPVSVNAVVTKVSSELTFVPHITDARHTEIYKSNIGLVNFAGDGYLAEIVYFYGLLERIKGQIDGVYLPSYINISGQGRANVINRIYDDARSCARSGEIILERMEHEYPGFRLKRKIRTTSAAASDASLKLRYDNLCLDLNRVRTAQGKSS